MPLVMMVGYPCSGKSSVAELLASYVSSHSDLKVVLVNAESLELDRNVAYKESGNNLTQEEKNTRGVIASAVERHVARNVLVICDSLNYIKGFRYQLYCMARAKQTPSCVLYCERDEEQVLEWNQAAQEGGRWEEGLLKELVMRFEPPLTTRRWERPTFVINAGNPEVPYEELLAYLTQNKQLVVNTATLPQLHSSANYLHDLNKITQEVARAIIQAQTGPLAVGAAIRVPHTDCPYRFEKKVTMAQLQKQRRTFVSMTQQLAKGPAGNEYNVGALTPAQIATNFVGFLHSS